VRAPDPEAIERAAPWLRKVRAYCRVQVEGVEKIPQGPCILAANHTGWAGIDYWNLFITVYDDAKRIPRVAVHPSYFRFKKVRDLADQLGFFEVSVATSTEILDEGGLVTFFPEAEEGNFKPIWKRYRLQPFKPGFARVALATEAPVVPVVIVGGEEANPTLGRLKPLEEVLQAPVPIPVNLLPFPVKWRIAFLDPVSPSTYLERESPDKDVAELMARDLRHRMQDALDEQVRKRGHPIL